MEYIFILSVIECGFKITSNNRIIKPETISCKHKPVLQGGKLPAKSLQNKQKQGCHENRNRRNNYKGINCIFNHSPKPDFISFVFSQSI